MGIVGFALRFRHTFYVLALMMLFLGGGAFLRPQKIFFQPNLNIHLSIAQIVSASNSIRAVLPPGIQPPTIIQYNASSVPVLQLSLSSDRLSEQQLYDYGLYRIRQALAPIQGITMPAPYGGVYKQIMIDLDPAHRRDP